MENETSEFKTFGKNIETISVYYGLFLILWGFVISFLAKSTSFTSYIPSFLGLLVLVFSSLSIKFQSKKKLFMHMVALLGLIIFLGGLDIIRLIIKNNLFQNFWADLSKIMMSFTGLIFLILCFRSFRFARRSISENKN